jgi:hypothetical protein
MQLITTHKASAKSNKKARLASKRAVNFTLSALQSCLEDLDNEEQNAGNQNCRRIIYCQSLEFGVQRLAFVLAEKGIRAARYRAQIGGIALLQHNDKYHRQ